MQNEARVFSYQPEEKPEAALVEGGEKRVIRNIGF